MKKYISIFELFARNTIYKIVLVLVAMGIAQIAMFHKEMLEWSPTAYYDSDLLIIEHYTLEYMVDRSNSIIFMGIAFVLITVILCWNGCNIGSKSSYTLQRLQVTEKKIFIMQSIYNSLCYVLLLGAQIGIFFIQSSLYVAQAGHVTNQTVFLAFYRNDFMHSVLPLEGTMRWVVSVLMVLGCGMSAAVFTYLQRRGKVAWSLFMVVACALVGFEQGLGDQEAVLMASIICGIVFISAYVRKIQQEEE